MNKFKVGDRVNTRYGTGTIKETRIGSNTPNLVYHDIWDDGHNASGYYTGDHCWWFDDSEIRKIQQSQKIIITTDGTTTTAMLKDGKQTVKTATAKCGPSDEFNFQTGAKIALDRLFGAGEKKPEPEFYSGKVVCVDNCHNQQKYTIGKIYEIKDGVMVADDGCKFCEFNPCESFQDWCDFTSSEFIEFKGCAGE